MRSFTLLHWVQKTVALPKAAMKSAAVDTGERNYIHPEKKNKNVNKMNVKLLLFL